MHSETLPFRSSSIHYRRGGSGSRLLICLHGYGESAAAFDLLEQPLGRDYTILAPDLPFHGGTDWKEGLFFDPDDLCRILLEMSAGLPGSEGPWSILGYSMGGRVALQLLEEMPDRIARLVLVAPDGLRMNPWYWLATQTWAGNRLFKWTMSHPAWLFVMLRMGNALGMVNRSVHKFTSFYIGDRKVRSDLYTRWTTLRGFRPAIGRIMRSIRERQIPVRLLYGRFDRIIRSATGERFVARNPANSRIILLPAGHRLLHPDHLPAIVSSLND